MVAVLLLRGLRISETLTLYVPDLNTQPGAILLRVTGKGAKPRTAVPPAPAVVAIRDWHEQRRRPWTAVGHRHRLRHAARAAHRLIVGRLGDTPASLSCTRAHPLRHTFATSAVDAGADVLKVTTALAHASPSTKMRYVRGRDVITGSPVNAVATAIINR